MSAELPETSLASRWSPGVGMIGVMAFRDGPTSAGVQLPAFSASPTQYPVPVRGSGRSLVAKSALASLVDEIS
jgi:hypothetical protein